MKPAPCFSPRGRVPSRPRQPRPTPRAPSGSTPPRHLRLTALALLLCAAGGCRPAPVQPGPAARFVERSGGAVTPAPTPPLPAAHDPGPVLLDVLEAHKSAPSELVQKEGRFSLSLRDADLREALIALAHDMDTNLVIEPEVTGKITVDLKRVTLEDALAFLLRPTFDYSFDGRSIRVFKPARVTQTFKVDYIATGRQGTSQVTATASGSSGGGGGGFASASTVQSEFKADFWEQLEIGVKALLSKDGNATVHRMAGLVTVTDVPDRLAAVKTYVDRLTDEVHGQILIQAELVEVSLENSFESGVDWNAVAHVLGGALTVGATSALPSGGLSVRLAGSDSSALLKALSQQGKLDVLSRPRILTLNNQKALMKVGREDVFFQTTLVPGLTGTTGAANSGTLPLSVSTPRTITVGILLDVSPQIRPNGRVALHVHLSITEKFGIAVSPDGRSSAPILDVREADAVVEVASGQTLAIGGLNQLKETETQSGVPFLSELPLVGALFRRKLVEKKKVELLLLMTPVVVRPNGGALNPYAITR